MNRRSLFHILALWVLPTLLCGCTAATVSRSTTDFPANRGFQPCQITLEGKKHSVWVFVPVGYKAGKPTPTILFLHGLFEAGNGGNKVLSGGLGPVIAQDPEHWPFLTILPQSDGDWRGPQHDALAMAALDAVQARWSVDRNRVILAGLSYGGLGVWEIGSKHVDRFAALVPVSGHASTTSVHAVTKLPIWAFSSRYDPWVKSVNSEEMVRSIDALGGRARWTEFDGDAHDCWSTAVFESDLVPWMLKQRRAGSFDNNQPSRALAFPITASAQQKALANGF